MARLMSSAAVIDPTPMRRLISYEVFAKAAGLHRATLWRLAKKNLSFRSPSVSVSLRPASMKMKSPSFSTICRALLTCQCPQPARISVAAARRDRATR